MVKRSEYSPYQKREREQILYVETQINNLGWKFRELSQDNDIDGEIEIFEEIEDDGQLKYQTTAKSIKVQLKAEDNCKIKDNYVIYEKCPIKFLHFCDVCDIPIILILYEANTKKAYWLWIQQYIYNILDIHCQNWRDNKNTVTIKLPINNVVNSEQVSFINEFKNIANSGINSIVQMRKSKTFKKYYTLMTHEDMSTGLLRRISVRGLIESSFSSSKDAMKVIIPKINQEFIISDYYRSKLTKQSFKNQESDIVWLFLYNDLVQLEHGLPFCRTEWIKNPQNTKPIIFSSNDHDDVIDNIKIKWDQEIITSDYIKNNELSKGQYVELTQDIYHDFLTLFSEITEIWENYNSEIITFLDLKQKILNLSLKIDQIYSRVTHEISYPPYQCADMNKRLIELVSLLHNISIIIRDKNKDKTTLEYLINDNLQSIKEKQPHYEYEKTKIQ